MVILVVEDSSAMRALICRTLQQIAGLVVIEATTGADALRKLSEIQADVIMTDINMPEMDGFSFIERLRQQPAHHETPVIVLTTEQAAEDRKRASKLGVRTYVTKPIRAADVIDAVQSVIGRVERASQPELPGIVLRVDYENAEELLGDYAASLSQGEIMVANRRALPVGTQVKIALAFPSLVDPIQLDGVVRFSSGGGEPTMAIDLVDNEQREQLAHVIERIRAAGGG